LRDEVVRKLIHVATVAIPVLVWVLPSAAAFALLTVGVVAAVAVEIARSRVRWARYHFLIRTRRLLRYGERRRFAGATYMAFAYFAAFVLFPRPVAVLAMLYNGLGDTAAALVGKRWGSHRMSWGKSFEGAAAAFFVNAALGAAIPGISLAAGLVGAAAAATLEFLPLPLDDNIRTTLGGGVALWAASAG
jgi:dolichol kinase